MRKLNFELKQLGDKNPDGAYSTRRDRAYALSLIADQLWEAGYKDLRVKSLKGRHVKVLVDRWNQEKLNPGTIKNRMSAIRWWASKIGKASIVETENAKYGVPSRVYVTNESKAAQLTSGDLDRVRDFHVRLSLELQREFGLRREEAIKFIPSYADQGDRIRLKPSWTKGGKAREIPITRKSQRELLDRLHVKIGSKPLIPSDRNYVRQLRVYERETVHAGLSKMHGLRHEYAQRRFEELTGWKAPAAGGPRSRQLSAVERAVGRGARLTISRELGHARESVTAVYCGR
ncbi:MAG: integrase domain-containing protein [Methylococcaceae bacterium]|nr:integrase domain-containing protein [Methylococcaceae bacterium]